MGTDGTATAGRGLSACAGGGHAGSVRAGGATWCGLALLVMLCAATTAHAQQTPRHDLRPYFGARSLDSEPSATAAMSCQLPVSKAAGSGLLWSRTLTAGGGSDGIELFQSGLRDAMSGARCRGVVTRRPDFVLEVSPEAGWAGRLLRVFVVTHNGADATLLVRTPDGSWRCEDDSWGTTHAGVDVDEAAPGAYAVWVGTYQPSSGNPATLYATDDPTIDARTCPDAPVESGP